MVNEHTTVTKRIKNLIFQIGRLLENEKYEAGLRLTNSCIINLNRIQSSINIQDYNNINYSLQSLKSYCEEKEEGARVNELRAYSAEHVNSGSKIIIC